MFSKALSVLGGALLAAFLLPSLVVRNMKKRLYGKSLVGKVRMRRMQLFIPN